MHTPPNPAPQDDTHRTYDFDRDIELMRLYRTNPPKQPGIFEDLAQNGDLGLVVIQVLVLTFGVVAALLVFLR